MYKISFFSDCCHDYTMRKYRIYFKKPFFLGGGGGGVGGEWWFICKLPMLSKKLAVKLRTKFKNTHWSDKSLIIVKDKLWK